MTRGWTGARAPRTCRPAFSGPLETVVLLGTASLELTGSFQAPGHLIHLRSLLELQLSVQGDWNLRGEYGPFLEQMEEGQVAK
jgi:hypothetical protein